MGGCEGGVAEGVAADAVAIAASVWVTSHSGGREADKRAPSGHRAAVLAPAAAGRTAPGPGDAAGGVGGHAAAGGAAAEGQRGHRWGFGAPLSPRRTTGASVH